MLPADHREKRYRGRRADRRTTKVEMNHRCFYCVERALYAEGRGHLASYPDHGFRVPDWVTDPGFLCNYRTRLENGR